MRGFIDNHTISPFFYMKKRSILCVKRVTLTIPPQAMINDSEMGESPFEN